MALVKIDSPSDAPLSVADWYKINAVLQTIGNGMGSGSKVVGTNFQRGAVLFMAGSWYIADSDTAITGTASDYVKVTNTDGVLSLSFVADITGVTWNKSYQGWYDASTNLYIFDEIKAYGLGIIDTLYSTANVVESKQLSFLIANLTGQFRKILKPSGKTILTQGSGTYIVPEGVYSLEYFLQGPGSNGLRGMGGSSGKQQHGFIEVTPNQTIAWVVSATHSTFGDIDLGIGGGFEPSFMGYGYQESMRFIGGGIPGANNGAGGNGGYYYQGTGGNTLYSEPTNGSTGRIELW